MEDLCKNMFFFFCKWWSGERKSKRSLDMISMFVWWTVQHDADEERVLQLPEVFNTLTFTKVRPSPGGHYWAPDFILVLNITNKGGSGVINCFWAEEAADGLLRGLIQDPFSLLKISRR